MNLKTIYRLAAASFAIYLASAGGARAAIINGDFNNGLTGWTISSVLTPGLAGALVTAGSQAGNGYASLSSGGFGATNIAVLSLQQSFMVDATATELVADFGLADAFVDPTGVPATPPAGGDLLSLSVSGGGSGSRAAFRYDQIRRNPPDLVEPTESIGGRAGIGTGLDLLSGPLFSYRVTADLSDFIGQTVTLSLDLLSLDDGQVTIYGFDNVALRAAAPPPGGNVPLPPTLLLLAAAGLLMRQRSRRHA